MAAQQKHQVPSGTDAQRFCARAERCSASTRDAEGAWHPAPANQPLCPADRTVLIQRIEALPGCYERLSRVAAEPVRRGRAVRVAPGSRVLANPEADALMRTVADILGGWAARVRSVPQLSLARHGFTHGSPGQVTADSATLAAHPDPLLALPAGDMARIWTWPPGSAMPGWLEEEIGALDAVAGGDGWVRAFTALDGEDAALELFDLHRRCVRLLGETPAPPELLDGVPCRSCEAMSSLEVLPQLPPDREKEEPAFSRCSIPGCRDEMTRREYDDWVKRYGSWTRGAGVLTCRRCELGRCSDCVFVACQCKASGHRKAA
jgi:hypothetical protein